MTTCPDCHSNVDHDLDFCPKCGFDMDCAHDDDVMSLADFVKLRDEMLAHCYTQCDQIVCHEVTKDSGGHLSCVVYINGTKHYFGHDGTRYCLYR